MSLAHPIQHLDRGYLGRPRRRRYASRQSIPRSSPSLKPRAGTTGETTIAGARTTGALGSVIYAENSHFMSGAIQKHLWADIVNAPALPGVYAWYYSPEITDYDLEQTISRLIAYRDTDRVAAEELVRTTLDSRIFQHFREEAYRANIEGPLKPTYTGTLEHTFKVSAGLVGRIVDDPDRLRTIRDVLDMSAPNFASPLYMGMAGELRSRLATHKTLIEKYRRLQRQGEEPVRNSDAGFAWQVAKRRIPPDRLIVYTCTTAADAKTAVDIEHILNRIYYPILGRN